MGASVEERVHAAVGASCEDDRSPSEGPSDKVVALGNLAVVADVDPRPAEDAHEFALENAGVGVDRAVSPSVTDKLVQRKLSHPHRSPRRL